MNFGVLLDDFGHFFITAITSDKSTLSDVITERQCVRIDWFSMASSAHISYASLMDSRNIPVASATAPGLILPSWSVSLRPVETESEAAFSAGIVLKTLDDLVRGEPVWAGCWRARLTLRSAAAAVRLTGRTEGEAELRDAMLLSSDAGDLGPAGNGYSAYRKLGAREGPMNTAFLQELATLLSLRWDDRLAGVVDLVDGATARLAAVFVSPDGAAQRTRLPHVLRPRAGATGRTGFCACGVSGAGRGRGGRIAVGERDRSAHPAARDGGTKTPHERRGGCDPPIAGGGCGVGVPLRALTFRAGLAGACSSGWRPPVLCGSFPAAARFGSMGFDDGRLEHRSSVSPTRAKTG
ncbi:DUF1403 family protein [Rhizobium sp. PP-CC-3G-465]|uniref:DUF1403 family protein n=1 Tax=Rhizobium sp. PP-CC-3G-465 TaxID=2135648 RepID=UPI0010CF887B|nr:uncharacterized protein DUF1403 [Rhizobium sp. PP-CC-3G-465]